MRALLLTGLLALLAGCNDPPATDAPPPPDNLGARSLGVRGIELGWRDRSDSTAWFVIERLDPGQETYTRAGLRPPGETQWVEWGLEPDSAYRYRVISATDSGLSKPSDPIEVKLPPTRIPEPRVEVFDPMAVSPGVTLFNVEDYHDVASVSVVMAVDLHGTVLWHLEHTGLLVTETDLFPGGDVLVQVGPVVSRLDRKGDVVIYLDQYFLHHDIDVLPWGNLIAITSRSVKDKQKFPTDLYSREDIVEVVPETGEIVWRLAFEDLLPASEICPACITTGVVGGQDWIHLNALDYDLDEEALYVSVRNSNRIYKLSFPLGEVEWIMGDNGDFGQGLFDHQHNPYRVAPHTFLVFDNGLHSDPLTPDLSRVIEIEYDPESLSSRIVWQYDGPPSFYSEAQGDASRLPNGNTLIVDSAGPRILEITPQGMPVWELTLPKPYVIYKAHRIENFP